MRVTYTNARAAESIAAPASKSEAQRALICAALCGTPTDIRISSSCDDTDAALRCISALGAVVRRTGGGVSVTPGAAPARALFDCGESGTALRFMLPLAAALGTEAGFVTRGSLAARPSEILTGALAEHGITVSASPLTVRGRMSGGIFRLDGGISSQYISGMLTALTLTGGTLEITGECVSRPYIDLTLHFLRLYGARIRESTDGRIFEVAKTVPLVSPGTVHVGGDWSGGAFCLAAGLIGSHPVTVTGLDPASPQGDRAVIDIFRSMGGRLDIGENSVTAYPSRLRGTRLTLTGYPDIVPPVACAACTAEGVTVIDGIPQLKYKESNRITSLRTLIESLGGKAAALPDGLSVRSIPGGIAGGNADAAGDHRVAMAAALLSLVSRGSVTLDGAETVGKSFPAFYGFIGSR